MFESIAPLLPEIAAQTGVQMESRFGGIIQDELREIPGLEESEPEQINDADLRWVYDERAMQLPWDLSPGYLAAFARNRGSAYTALRVYEVLEKLLPPVEGKRILEVGCGAGILAVELARRGAIATGIEVASRGVLFGSRLARRMDISRASFGVADGEDLPFRDASCDLVISSEVLEHFLRPEKALAEMRRVLKPEGRLLITTPCAFSPSEACMAVARFFKPDLQVESETHFDKKLYFAVAQDGRPTDPRRFWRVHRRFEYAPLVETFRRQGFELERSLGAVLDVPPHFHLTYRYLLAPFLSIVRAKERVLNWLRILPRFGAVSTCFLLRPRGAPVGGEDTR